MRDEQLEGRLRRRLREHTVALDTDALWAGVAAQLPEEPTAPEATRRRYLYLSLFLAAAALCGYFLTAVVPTATPPAGEDRVIALDSVPPKKNVETNAPAAREREITQTSLRERERSGTIVKHTQLGTPPPPLSDAARRQQLDSAALERQRAAEARKAKAAEELADRLAKREARLAREAAEGKRGKRGKKKEPSQVVSERARLAAEKQAEREHEAAVKKARKEAMAEHRRAEEERLRLEKEEAARAIAAAEAAEWERLAELARREDQQRKEAEAARRAELAKLAPPPAPKATPPPPAPKLTKAERRAQQLALRNTQRELRLKSRDVRLEARRLAKLARAEAVRQRKTERRESALARAERQRQRRAERDARLAERRTARDLAKAERLAKSQAKRDARREARDARIAARLARKADRLARREARRAERLARREARRERRRLRRENNPIYWTGEPLLAVSAPLRSGGSSAEKSLEAIHIQALAGYHRKKGLSLRGGLAYSSITSKVEDSETEVTTVPRTAVIRIIRNPDGSQTEETGTVQVKQTTERTVRYYNTLSSIDVPLLAGYSWQQGRFVWLAEAGPSFNLSSSGSAHLRIGDGFSEVGSGHFIGRRKGIGFLANMSAAYALTDKNSLTLGLRIQSFGGSFEAPEISSSTRVTAVGLQVGYRMRF